MANNIYQYRVQANMYYDPSTVHSPPALPELKRFTELLWHGYDGGICVYRKDHHTWEIVNVFKIK